jgi:phage protein D
MALASVDVEHFAPRFEIEVNNTRLAADVSHMVRSVDIVQELNRTLSFSFDVQDEFMGDGFKWLGHTGRMTQEIFKYGNNVAISTGYANRLVKMCEGRIQNITATFDRGIAPSFKVEGSDAAFVFLTTPSDARTFSAMSDSQIVQRIAEEAHLSATVDDTGIRFPRKTKKGGETWLKFLTDLAKTNHFEFRLAGRDLTFIKPKQNEEPIGTLAWGRELMSFRPRLQTSGVYSAVVVKAWDRTRRKKIEESARAGDEQRQEPGKEFGSQVARQVYGGAVKVISDQPVRTPAEAKKLAQAELDKSSSAVVEASGETVGLTELRPGVCITLDGLGMWFSGKYYLTKVTHTIGDGGYRSQFEAKRNAL